jgi:hypothetical protein
MVAVLIGVVNLLTFRVMGASSCSSNFGFPCSICTKRENVSFNDNNDNNKHITANTNSKEFLQQWRLLSVTNIVIKQKVQKVQLIIILKYRDYSF